MKTDHPVPEEQPLCPPPPGEGQNPAPEPPPAIPPAAPEAACPPVPAGMAAVPMGWRPKKPRAPFAAGRAEGLLCAAFFPLGFLAVRWLSAFAGWGVGAFTGLYVATVLLYARAKKLQPPKQSWFWMAVTLLCGLAFVLWPGKLLSVPRSLLLCGAAVYWCGSLFGVLLKGKTSNYLPMDAVNLLFALPFGNMDTVPQSLKTLRGKKEGKKGLHKTLLPVLLGLLLCVPLLAVVLPMLLTADAGLFGLLLKDFFAAIENWNLWAWLDRQGMLILVQVVFGVPVGLYLFSLLAGAAAKRNANRLSTERADNTLRGMKKIPKTTVLVVLVVVSAVYALFIGCQLPYFFSAFGGVKPSHYPVYSEYAREGFFELCRIAGINMGLLAVLNSFCAQSPRQSRAMRVANHALCALTLLVIATAFSKMALYIVMHGFTPKRVTTCVFMVFLAGLCVAVMLLQTRQFSIVRFAAVFGAGLLCALCLCNLDGLVLRYNAARYGDGSLDVFNELIVLRAGPAGVEEALAIYETLDDVEDYEQKQRLAYAITRAAGYAQSVKGTAWDDATSARVRSLPLPYSAEQDKERERLFYEEYGELR